MLAYDCTSDSECMTIIKDAGLNSPASAADIEAYFKRKRVLEESKELIKIYKLTQEEIDMNDSSLEKSVLNRIGTKFYS